MEFVQIAQSFGVPLAILAALCVAIWRILVWLRPWAEKLFAAHLTLVNTTSATITQLAEIQGRQEQSLAQIAEAIRASRIHS